MVVYFILQLSTVSYCFTLILFNFGSTVFVAAFIAAIDKLRNERHFYQIKNEALSR